MFSVKFLFNIKFAFNITLLVLYFLIETLIYVLGPITCTNYLQPNVF